MRRMVGAIPRGLPDHRTLEGHVYREYVAAKVGRYPGRAPDGRPWLKEAGRLVVALDRLTVEVESVRLTLSSGAGRRARDKARGVLRQLERRAARLRLALTDAEGRLG